MPSVLITGAAGNLGRAVASRFAADGWHVAPVDLHDDLAAVAAAAAATAPLTALVATAGGFHMGGRVHEATRGDFDNQFDLNVHTAVDACRAVIPHMLDHGEGGSIVCVSSRAALKPFSGAAPYIVSKAAVLALVDALAVEYLADNIRANAIIPGVIDTPANRADQPDADFSRWVPPGQIAETVVAMCSPAMAATSGAHIPVYGRS